MKDAMLLWWQIGQVIVEMKDVKMMMMMWQQVGQVIVFLLLANIKNMLKKLKIS